MIEIKYTSSKKNPTKISPNDLVLVEKFFEELTSSDEILHIICQPGDSTKYELYVVRLGENKILFSNTLNNHCWYLSTWAVPEDFRQETFENSRCVFADIATKILGNNLSLFFDWSIARKKEFENATS